MSRCDSYISSPTSLTLITLFKRALTSETFDPFFRKHSAEVNYTDVLFRSYSLLYRVWESYFCRQSTCRHCWIKNHDVYIYLPVVTKESRRYILSKDRDVCYSSLFVYPCMWYFTVRGILPSLPIRREDRASIT